MSLKLGTTDISGVPTTLINTVNNKLDASTYTSNPRTNAVYITETYHSGSSWYRVWSDGFIEQGGTVSTSSTTLNYNVIFLKKFTSTDYQVITSGERQSSWSNDTNTTNANWVVTAAAVMSLGSSKSIRGFHFTRTGDSTFKTYWYACGY